ARTGTGSPYTTLFGSDCERERINLEFVCKVQAREAEPLVLRGVGKLLASGRAIVLELAQSLQMVNHLVHENRLFRRRCAGPPFRSEEHTSELQALRHL